MQQQATYHLYPCGDHAVTIELGTTVSVATHQRVLSLFNYLKKQAVPGVRDIIPAYHTVTVVYDIIALARKTKGVSVYEYVCEWIEDALNETNDTDIIPQRSVKIPVCYHESLAPDLVSLAKLHDISTDEVIELHTKESYRVFMIGFLPGFAYMGSVNAAIATPRHQQPRINVPAGSVGIAGEQTGIYPFDSPGGWQLIGQTPVPMFTADGGYLQPGDDVSFVSISLNDFNNWPRP